MNYSLPNLPMAEKAIPLSMRSLSVAVRRTRPCQSQALFAAWRAELVTDYVHERFSLLGRRR